MHWRSPSAPGPADAELEMLQTDTMRFFAIIALCLVAIFALVQQATPVDTRGGQRGELHEQALELQQLRQQVATQQREIQELKQHRLSPPMPAPVSRPEPAAKPVDKPDARPEAPARAFALQFASDAALMQLLKRGTVALVLGDQGRSWQWQRGRFTTGHSAGDYYQLALDTVPAALRLQARRQQGVQGGDWKIRLPQDIRGEIATIMRSQTAGTLVIDAVGDVQLKQ